MSYRVKCERRKELTRVPTFQEALLLMAQAFHAPMFPTELICAPTWAVYAYRHGWISREKLQRFADEAQRHHNREVMTWRR